MIHYCNNDGAISIAFQWTFSRSKSVSDLTNSVTNEAGQLVFLGFLETNIVECKNIRQLSQDSEVPWRIIHGIKKFHPYKFSHLQEPNEVDDDRWLQFCE